MKVAVLVHILVFAGSYASGRQVARLPAGDSERHSQPVMTFRSITPVGNMVMQPVPRDFYCNGLGFFCRQELKMQKQNIPVIFRLGSVDNCNRLEQKPGYR
jgi:hypothetical protein